jgi:hypothetical protein
MWVPALQQLTGASLALPRAAVDALRQVSSRNLFSAAELTN